MTDMVSELYDQIDRAGLHLHESLRLLLGERLSLEQAVVARDLIDAKKLVSHANDLKMVADLLVRLN